MHINTDDRFFKVRKLLNIFDKNNIIEFDDNILIYALDKEEKKAEHTVKYNYLIYNENEVIVNEEIDLIAFICEDNSEYADYILKLSNIKAFNEIDLILGEKPSEAGILLYRHNKINVNDSLLYCNYLEDEIMRNSCADIIQDLILKNLNEEYKLTYNKKDYIFSRLVWTKDINNSNISNIGKFVSKE